VTRSSNVSLNTAFGVPAAAHISPGRDTTIQIESTENGRHAPFLPSMNSILHCEMDNQFPGLYVATGGGTLPERRQRHVEIDAKSHKSVQSAQSHSRANKYSPAYLVRPLPETGSWRSASPREVDRSRS
jgi:hypothetical protein